MYKLKIKSGYVIEVKLKGSFDMNVNLVFTRKFLKVNK